ncbi:GNAT family N-acetyltransferase [Nostoc sp. CHAB 5714]|uniref:GNAT family N-acetyltransferase n=1 Tax=Nostoc favosum CHAB5714 TaxID=2780399 RepID=A0ABS8IKF3_9NOSO|nr:GNAT family N-acetyltransferase [Nostoc favosum CHAB5714]
MLHHNPASAASASYKAAGFTQRFEDLVKSRDHRSRGMSRSVTAAEACDLAAKLRRTIDGTADDAALLRVLAHNPEVLRLAERDDGGELGFVAYLPLNARGYAAMLDGGFQPRDPDTALLCRAGERPVAAFIWCAYAPGQFVAAVAAMTAHFEEVVPGGVTMFTRAATPSAARLFESIGFVQAVDFFPGIEPDVLVVFPAHAQPVRATPAAAVRPGQVRTRIARTIEDTMKVFAIRSATFIADQSCPYDEEFDGNDFCGAHLLGEIDGEPAGCIRVRFFGDFVKLERLAVRPEFRKSSLAFKLVRAAIDYARTKGFRTMYGHARHDLVAFWSRFGFRVVEDRPTFRFSDVDYVEMIGEISASPQPVGLACSPYELIRPEGAWDVPGPLDRSAARSSGRPRVGVTPNCSA